MSAVEAARALAGKMSDEELRDFGLTREDIGQLTVATILSVATERARQ